MATDSHEHDASLSGDRIVMEALAAETPENAIYWREGDRQGTKFYPYVDESFLRFRLDSVVGPDNWECDTILGSGYAKTVLSVALPSGKVITRSGISGCCPAGSNPKEDTNIYMGAETNSFKRACARFGIASDLKGKHYHPDNETPRQPQGNSGRSRSAPAQGGQRRDLGEPSRQGVPPAQSQNGSGNRGGGNRPPQNGHRNYGIPKKGSHLFAFLKSKEGDWPDIIDFVNNEAKINDCPFDRIVGYDEGWCKWAYEIVTNEINRGARG